MILYYLNSAGILILDKFYLGKIMAGLDAGLNLGVSQEEISRYFDGQGWKFIAFLILLGGGLVAMEQAVFGLPGLGLAAVLLFFRFRKKKASDEEIDNAWTTIAKAREDEAYRVAHLDKGDAIRDAEYFWAFPEDFSSEVNYKTKEGADGYTRRNHQRLVYMIYGKDQLIIFDENICVEDLWDGADATQEYYWSDVSSVGFDQKTNVLEVICGPKTVLYPLAGEEDEDGETYSTKEAEAISNSIRVMLRERKSS